MTLRTLALKNLKGNYQKYLAYILSSVFTISVFFIYANFIFHPDIINGNIRSADNVRQGLIAAEYIIIVFSFFFILYSNSSFIKSRNQEFGLLSLFGMTKKQIRLLIYFENTVISIISTGLGVIIGLLFSKLFLMIISGLMALEKPITFIFNPTVIVATIIGFLLLFQLLSLLTMFQIRKLEIIQLIRGRKQAKGLPLYSKWLAILAIVTIGIGYYLAWTMSLLNVFHRILPILILVIFGTYFLLTQASVAFFKFLQKRKQSYYKGTNLLSTANLMFQVKDNARVLFLASILSAVVFTAAGTMFILYADMKAQTMYHHPQSVAYIEVDATKNAVIDKKKVEQIANAHNLQLEYSIEVTGIPLTTDFHYPNGETLENNGLLISNTDYNDIAKKKGHETLSLASGESRLVFPYKEFRHQFFEVGEMIEATIDEEMITLTMGEQIYAGLLNSFHQTSQVFVVEDELFNSIAKQIPLDKQIKYFGFEYRNWQQSAQAVEEMTALISHENISYFQQRIEDYTILKSATALTLFIGLFVSLLFFIASGSLVYFKLFTELDEMKEQLKALKKIGMTKKEMRQLLTKQIGFIFLIPFIIGTTHAAFAYKALSALLQSTIWHYGLLVISVFFLLQLAYFFLTKKMYEKAVFER